MAEPKDLPEDFTEEQTSFHAMPFLDHLEELRKRLLKSLLAVVITTGIALYFSKQIMHWFIMPLGDIKLNVTEVMGSFMAYFKLGLVVGIIASVPIIFYQLWGFVAPGLYPKEKRMVLPFVGSATLLFLIGAAFCYIWVLPWSLQFLVGLSGDLFNPIITINSYITFAGLLILGFGLCFELPVLAYALGKIGILSSRFLARGRKYAIVIILIVAAIITPTPDVFTQLLLAVPMYVLYEISIVVVRLTGRRK
ncbi:twin-arginine translocase subunit TatC [candidate division GN15 bacterium]|uniref:Sec-independent protein translocase protein TatC n=1 Tax=candidate division GN15 bacterium TaxID=2072418 RepID=A0A855X028_9BACT|nr:MAG: twin-arginine translocase subunit TatC [candidate division GN15 bacterium]